MDKAIIDSLPETINLVGVASNRSVYINEKLLLTNPGGEIEYTEGMFDWGTFRNESWFLAVRLLEEIAGEQFAAEYQDLFRDAIISQLRGESFCVDITIWAFFSNTEKSIEAINEATTKWNALRAEEKEQHKAEMKRMSESAITTLQSKYPYLDEFNPYIEIKELPWDKIESRKASKMEL